MRETVNIMRQAIDLLDYAVETGRMIVALLLGLVDRAYMWREHYSRPRS